MIGKSNGQEMLSRTSSDDARATSITESEQKFTPVGKHVGDGRRARRTRLATSPNKDSGHFLGHVWMAQDLCTICSALGTR